MSRNNLLGIIGGALIILAAFLTGTGFEFNSNALDSTIPLILAIAGAGVIVFLLINQPLVASFCGIAALTLGTVVIVDLVRNNALEFTVQLGALVLGVILALIASVARRTVV